MKRRTAFLAVIAFFAVSSAVYAIYEGYHKGTWTNSWPKELEPLRKQSRTLVGPLMGPMALNRHYEIPFAKREQFEAAWPYLLKVKSMGAPIILVRGPKTDFFEVKPAGVLIHSPPAGTDQRADPEEPLGGTWPNERTRWMKTTFIELVVDGNIVDLNRIPLPADTPIIDERFKDADTKAPSRSGPATQKDILRRILFTWWRSCSPGAWTARECPRNGSLSGPRDMRGSMFWLAAGCWRRSGFPQMGPSRPRRYRPGLTAACV